MNDLKFNPVTITGVGKATPETVITNNDLSKILDTNDEWIKTRTGIEERRVLKGNEKSSDLAYRAASDALAYAGVDPQDLDCIIVATSTPDNLFPSISCELQAMFKVENIPAFDVVAACTGMIYGLSIARNFIAAGSYEKVLVVGVDANSRFVNWEDRSTCVLFGDAAGAMVVEKSQDGQNDILAVTTHANGVKGMELKIPLNGKNCPLVDPKDEQDQFMYMNGREIYKFAVSVVPASIQETLKIAGLEVKDLDYVATHQANIRIIEAIKDRLNLTDDQVASNLHKYGNTSAASIPLVITEAFEEGKMKSPSIVAISGFGAGLTWGTAIVRWRAEDKRKK